jgi:hypothetical protein
VAANPIPKPNYCWTQEQRKKPSPSFLQTSNLRARASHLDVAHVQPRSENQADPQQKPERNSKACADNHELAIAFYERLLGGDQLDRYLGVLAVPVGGDVLEGHAEFFGFAGLQWCGA